MRVIAGKCRSLPLRSVPGKTTRPTTDRIKETLFNILQTRIPDAVFLDLFAGSGAIGIEALSRGASHAWFVENDRTAVRVIRDNLQFTKLTRDADILQADAADASVMLAGKAVFDVIFMDPPYGQDLEKKVLLSLRGAECVHPDTLFVIEASCETSFDWLEASGFVSVREKYYKTNKHVFVKARKGADI